MNGKVITRSKNLASQYKVFTDSMNVYAKDKNSSYVA